MSNLQRWDSQVNPAKKEHAYECFLTEFGDEHSYTDEQMSEYCNELRHQEGIYALSASFGNIEEMYADFHQYWQYHEHAPFNPFASH